MEGRIHVILDITDEAWSQFSQYDVSADRRAIIRYSIQS